MTHSVIHYWCLPQPGWWIIKPLIRPGNSAFSSADDTHLHKSHAAIFHTLAHKHKHTPTNSQIHKVHTCWLALWWAWLIQFLMLSAKKPPQKTSFVSYLEEPSSFELWIQIHKGYTVHDNSTQQLQPYNTQWLKTICSKSHGLHRTCVAFPERQPCFALKLNNRITMHR